MGKMWEEIENEREEGIGRETYATAILPYMRQLVGFGGIFAFVLIQYIFVSWV